MNTVRVFPKKLCVTIYFFPSENWFSHEINLPEGENYATFKSKKTPYSRLFRKIISKKLSYVCIYICIYVCRDCVCFPQGKGGQVPGLPIE